MIMEHNDNDIRNLFSSYNPQLSSDAQFMERLERSLNSVEMVRKRNVARIRQSRIAAGIAAVAGFAAGMVCTMAMPALRDTMNFAGRALSNIVSPETGTGSGEILLWITVASISVIVAVNSYELALSLMRRREQ